MINFDLNQYDFSVLTKSFWNKKINKGKETGLYFENYTESFVVKKYFQIKRFFKIIIKSGIKKILTLKNRLLIKLGF